jgi:UDP-N-acetylglucosamine pyrophosphorylase
MVMRSTPGFLVTLQQQLESLPLETLERVNRFGGLGTHDLMNLLVKPVDYSVDIPDPSVPSCRLEDASQDTYRLGNEAIKDGSTAYCILAGGSGTRIGTSKGFLRLPGTSTSLLSLKLLQAGPAKNVWVMASPGNEAEIRTHLNAVGGQHVKVFTQYESFRLTPDNRLHFVDGQPDLHPCGHGDVIPALKNSGLYDDFVSSGGKRVVVVNVDNVYATMDPGVVGQHIVGGRPVTCEVVERTVNDTGGVLCSHLGFEQIVEQFRLSPETNVDEFGWLSTNSMVFNTDIDFNAIRWSWHRVKKNVAGQLLVQYERLLQELTSNFKTLFLAVPRSSRYVPVKTQADLEKIAKIFNRS